LDETVKTHQHKSRAISFSAKRVKKDKKKVLSCENEDLKERPQKAGRGPNELYHVGRRQ
jgi:hypothetical protein